MWESEWKWKPTHIFQFFPYQQNCHSGFKTTEQIVISSYYGCSLSNFCTHNAFTKLYYSLTHMELGHSWYAVKKKVFLTLEILL